MADRLKRKRVAIPATDYVERTELAETRQALEDAGATTDLISLEPGTIQAADHHEDADTHPVDRPVGEVDADEYDALLMPGGVANPDRLRTEHDRGIRPGRPRQGPARSRRSALKNNPNHDARKERPMATRQQAKAAEQKVRRTQWSGGAVRGRAFDDAQEQGLDPGEMRIFSDAVGASNLMREIVALRSVDAALVEEGGHWHVDVRAGGETSELSRLIFGLAASCVDERRMAFATICIGKRSYSLYTTPDPTLGAPVHTMPAAA